MRFDRFTLDFAGGCLRAGDVDLKLRPKSFEVLAYLARNAGRLVSKDEILESVWRGVVVTDNSLAQCIREIRSTLGGDAERFIRTVPRRGYLFVVDVASVASGARDGPAADAWNDLRPIGADSGYVATAADKWSGVRNRPLGGWVVLLLALALPLIAAVSIWSLLTRPIPSLPAGGLTLAVLPFESLNADEHLAQGLAEDLITALSRFRDVTVFARNASFRYRGAHDPVRVGSELRAAFVVRGSIARDGDSSRVTVQLVDSSSGVVRWAGRYDRPMTTLFALQDEVAERVVSTLVAHAQRSASERVLLRPPTTLEAYELVLKARLAFSNYGRKGSDEALALLDQALQLDPRYSAAWGMLARVHLRLYLHPFDARHLSTPVLEQALAAAQNAVALDPDSSYAHAALGYARLWQHRYDESIRSLRQAIALNPNDATAFFFYGDVLGRAGEQRASIEALERARQLDPFAPSIVMGLLARGHVMLGEHEKALAISRDCADSSLDVSACLVTRLISATVLGHHDEAQASLRRLLQLYPNYSIGRWVRRFKHDRDEQDFVAYLRRAGVPE